MIVLAYFWFNEIPYASYPINSFPSFLLNHSVSLFSSRRTLCQIMCPSTFVPPMIEMHVSA